MDPGRPQQGRVERVRRAAILVWTLAFMVPVLAPVVVAGVQQERDSLRRDERARRRELAIRAQFLRHFCSYVAWQESRFEADDAPFVIGVVGDDPFGRLLEQTFEDEEVQDRAVRIRRAGKYAELDEEGRDALRECHALVVAETDRAVQGRIIEALAEHGVLLIAHEPGFAAAGGHIQTFVRENKVRFEVNRKALQAAALNCRAALLKLSRRGPRPGPESEPEPGPHDSSASRAGNRSVRGSGPR